jgi:CBS domain-containing protein
MEGAMRVNEIMTPGAQLMDPNTTIRDAARRMRADNLGAFPIGENDRLIGMVTDRDIVVRGVAEGRADGNATVRDVMSERVYYCFDDDEADQAAMVMAEHQVRRLPVLNRDKRLVGIVALADLGLNDDYAAQQALEGIAEPSDKPRR